LVAIEIRGCPSQPEIDFEDQHQNRRMGVTKAQYIDATMDFMEKTAVFNTRYQKRFEAAAMVLQEDGSKQVCRLKQTCTPKGAGRKYLTTVTDVMFLNHADGLDVAHNGT